MDQTFAHASTHLDRGALLRLRRSDGQTLAVLGGVVWITQDDDPADIVLSGGETHTFDVSRRGILIEALEPARFFMLAPLGLRGRSVPAAPARAALEP